MNIPASEANERLSALIAEAERGQVIIITRHGLPVAKLVPANHGFDREKARTTAKALRESSRGNALGDMSIKNLMEDLGR